MAAFGQQPWRLLFSYEFQQPRPEVANVIDRPHGQVDTTEARPLPVRFAEVAEVMDGLCYAWSLRS